MKVVGKDKLAKCVECSTFLNQLQLKRHSLFVHRLGDDGYVSDRTPRALPRWRGSRSALNTEMHRIGTLAEYRWLLCNQVQNPVGLL